MIQLPRKAKGQRPVYFSDPAVDRLLSMSMALAGEVCVLRDRLDTIEHLLERGEKVSRRLVDDFVPDAELRALRDARRDQFLGIILKRLHEDQEEMAEKMPTSYDAVVSKVETA